uniref:Ribosomal protein L2 n=1 Tax=Closterium baillyanum TaxID=1416941 RepID=U5YGJ8_9VIRI|nr:ribosomal protein L2 [Closterium baillyanum]AGZ90250.1 ribosomal protein L2 [Closterium baillyanum]
MNKICWKGKAFKQLSFGKTKSAGRNSYGCITIFHRGGGSKRLQRRIDFQRNTLSTGVVERIEYDPNRSSRIALIRWSSLELKESASDDAFGTNSTFGHVSRPLFEQKTAAPEVAAYSPLRGVAAAVRREALGKVPMHSSFTNQVQARPLVPKNSFELCSSEAKPLGTGGDLKQEKFFCILKKGFRSRAYFSYILACDQLKSGDEVMNLHLDSASGVLWRVMAKPFSHGAVANMSLSIAKGAQHATTAKQDAPVAKIQTENLKLLVPKQRLYQKIGTNSTLLNAALGSLIHNIESYPGQGGKLVRAAGTKAQLVQKFENRCRGIVRLPSGRQYLLDLQCRATIGVVSNTSHSTRKLTKAGQSRWLGKRPVVRGVAMNPIDHPHGGGAGRTKGGRPSVSPWGKPTKGAKKKALAP